MKRKAWTDNDIQLLSNMAQDKVMDRREFEKALDRPWDHIWTKAHSKKINLCYIKHSKRFNKIKVGKREVKPNNQPVSDRIKHIPVILNDAITLKIAKWFLSHIALGNL